ELQRHRGKLLRARMLESSELLQEPRHHLARLLRFGVRLVQSAEVGQSVRECERCLDACQRRIDRDLTTDLFRQRVASRAEVAVQAVRFPSQTTELSVRLGVLIAEVSVRGLNLLDRKSVV